MILPLRSRVKVLQMTACFRKVFNRNSVTYSEHFQRSLNSPEDYWNEAAQEILWFKKYNQVLDNSNPPFSKWFVGGQMNTCYNLLDRHVLEGFGNQVAVFYDSPVTGKKSMFTYSELMDQASKFARVLVNLGVKKGDRVLIYMPMIPQSLIAMHGCSRIGAVHVTVFGGFAPNELARRIDDSKPIVMVTASCGIEPNKVIGYESLVDKALNLASHSPKHIVTVQREQLKQLKFVNGFHIDWDDKMESALSHDCVPLDSDDPLYIIYTSGTTGRPKGIVRGNGCHGVALKWSMKHIYDLKPGERWWAASDIGWVVGHSYIVYGPLLNRSTSILFEGKPIGCPDAGTFSRIIDEYDVVSLFTAPTAMRVIRNADPDGDLSKKYKMEKLRVVFLAGENCEQDLLKWTSSVFKRPALDHWWQTESGWPITSHHIGLGLSTNYQYGSSGKPSPGWNVKVLNKRLEECKTGELGEIYVKLPLPPGAMQTLWNNDSKYVETYFTKGYYMTMDTGKVDDNGYIHIGGRIDDIINVAGHRLSTKQMEMAIGKHPDVSEQVVLGMNDSIKGVVPVGLVVLKKHCTKSNDDVIKEVIALVRNDVGPVAALKKVVVLPTLPKTRAGKFVRGVLKKILNGEEYQVPLTLDNVDDFHEVECILKNYKNL
ncbi:acyl-CoA synthetase short-chain family member 3, mitochondrial isoform X2 [Hydra vulgaris]|uniref:Acyl-CoA synthetase short-chain family member 3, mitochondrial n=1 Tax=Hydra vulgaris TaxID=6087 RepID=A0ABM4BDP2_HYDVU